MRDCWRRCLAQLLGKDAEAVPDFVGLDAHYWLADTSIWLKERGHDLVALVSIENGAGVDVASLVTTSRDHIRVGLTKDGHHHAVVVSADGATWDPLQPAMEMVTTLGMYWVVANGQSG